MDLMQQISRRSLKASRLISMDLLLCRMLAILTAAQRVLLKEQMKKEELYNEEREVEEKKDEVEERNGKVNDLLYIRTATKLAMNMAQAAKLASNYSLSSCIR